MMEGVFLKQAVNTLKAPRWKLWLARILGKRSEGRDGSTVVVMYRWRGVTYVTDYRDA